MAANFFKRIGQALGIVPGDRPSPPPPQQQQQPVIVNTPTDINNSDTNVVNFAPVINLPEIKLNPNINNQITNNIDLVDEAYNLAQLKIVNHLMVGLVSGSAAVVMNESPLYYGSLGLITSGSKIYATPYFGKYDTVAAVAGGAAISSAFGKDLIASGVILGIGSLAGNMLR